MVMIVMMPLMLMMLLLMICADESLPAMKWLAEASPPATGKRMWSESRTGIGGRRVWEGMWNLLAARLARRSWGWED